MIDDISLGDALRLIDDCERRGVAILGMEWFHRAGRTVMSAGVADLSGARAADTWAEARRLLADGIPDDANTVEIVTGDQVE